MRILVTGAYGLIGSACLTRLQCEGFDLVGAGRSVAEARRCFPFVQWVAADFAELTTATAWQPLLASIEAVVNCVGVLQDGARDDSALLQAATCALFDASRDAGIRRVIHISAIGAAPDGPTAFSRTKAAAEAHLAALDLDWVILRPALVLGPAVHGGSAMLRALAAVPLVTPLIAGESRIQVIALDEVAETVAHCLAPTAPAKVTYELAHPQVYSLREIVLATRAWLGFPPRPVVALPNAVAAIVSALADALGWLGWRSPARSTALAQLSAGVIGDPAAWMAATGIAPKRLDTILAATPAGVQERWFARLYLIKPVAIAALALFWILTGAFALGPGYTPALGLLQAAGFGAYATFVLVAGSIFDIVLGSLLLLRRLARGVLITMLVSTAGYLLVGTLAAPELWFDPLGPYLKIIPMLVATLFTLAILDER